MIDLGTIAASVCIYKEYMVLTIEKVINTVMCHVPDKLAA